MGVATILTCCSLSDLCPPSSHQAISMEILALYVRPKCFLDDLEKEVGLLREKKQVEIKEIHVKNNNSSKVSSANRESLL